MNGWLRSHALQHTLKVIYDLELKRYIAKVEGRDAPPLVGIGITVEDAIGSLHRVTLEYEIEQERRESC